MKKKNIYMVLLLLILPITGYLLLTKAPLFQVITVQPVKISSIDDEGTRLRITALITDEQKAVKIVMPSTYPIDDERYWRFDTPLEIRIIPTAFYSVTPITKTVYQEGFTYGKGKFCITRKRKTLSYKELGEPYQVLKYKVIVRSGTHTLGRKEAVISPNTPSRISIDDITINFPGWLSRGVVPPTKDYVLKNNKVFYADRFLIDFYYYSSTTDKWQGWLEKYGDCDTAYTDQQIFVTGVTNSKGKKWTPPSITMPPSVTKYEVRPTEVRWHHPLLLGATGVVTITLPKSLVDAQIIEVTRPLSVEIVSVDGLPLQLSPGESKPVYVTIKNKGSKGGTIQISADSAYVDGTVSVNIKPNSEKVVKLYLTSRDVRTRMVETVVLKLYGAGKLQDEKQIEVTLQPTPKPDGSTNGGDDSNNEIQNRVMIISDTGVIFKGDNIYRGKILAINVKKVGVETGQGLTSLTIENVRRVLLFPLMHKFTLVTSNSDTDGLRTSVLLYISVESKEPMLVIHNNDNVATDTTTYSYTSPLLYVIVIILVVGVQAGIYFAYRRRKGNAK